MEDPYLREKGFDIENVGKRILKNLLGFEDDDPKRFAGKSMEDTDEIEELVDERVSLVLNDLSDDTSAKSRNTASRPPSTA